MKTKTPPGRSPAPDARRVLEELRAPLAVILAATQNLRSYRERLSADQARIVVDDLAMAAEEMSRRVDDALATGSSNPQSSTLRSKLSRKKG